MSAISLGLLRELRSGAQVRRLQEVAEETEGAEAAEPSEEKETIAEETGKTVVEETAVAQAAETVETVEEEAAEPPQAELVESAEEAAVAEIVEAPDIIEGVTDVEAGELYYYGTGRRKTASAQVRLYPTKDPEIVVNDKQVDQYFSRSTDLSQVRQPLQATGTENMFRITAKVRGGGVSGQAVAVRHGISRALAKANPELRLTLRKEGFLTRDPRVKERKKPGLKRARKAPQYTKR